ncbi:MAG: cation transporter [Clostridia bacterium]|nr:cation transporter [Clostridia bacterium]
MTNLFLKLFIKDDPQTAKGRTGIGKLSGIVGIICNILLCIAKLIIGTLSGSVSITADALNNLSDASGAVVTLLGFKLSEKPADEEHPYGHARFEYLSGLLVSALIILIGFELAKSSLGKIIHPTAVEISAPLIVVLIFSIGVKLWLSFFNKKLSTIINSAALSATASDSRNDVIATSAVLIAALIELFTGLRVDGYIGLAVALFILYSGASLAKETISPLLGENADSHLKQLISDSVSNHPLVLGYHDLMVHDYGPGQRFASMHVEMDVAEDPMLCHDIIDDLERECLKNHNVHLVIHYDPVVTGDEELNEMKTLVSDILKNYNEHISIHDFRMVKGIGHTNLIFDAVLPYGLESKKVKNYLDGELKKKEETYYTVITFDFEAFNN